MRDCLNKKIENYKLITDGRILNGICKKYNIQYDKIFKYVTDDKSLGYFLAKNSFTLEYKKKQYKLLYTSGCFYPYIAQIQ